MAADCLERVELGGGELAWFGEPHRDQAADRAVLFTQRHEHQDLDLGRVEKQEVVRCGSLITADDDDLPRLHLVFVRHRAFQEARPNEPLGDLRRGAIVGDRERPAMTAAVEVDRHLTCTKSLGGLAAEGRQHGGQLDRPMDLAHDLEEDGAAHELRAARLRKTRLLDRHRGNAAHFLGKKARVVPQRRRVDHDDAEERAVARDERRGEMRENVTDQLPDPGRVTRRRRHIQWPPRGGEAIPVRTRACPRGVVADRQRPAQVLALVVGEAEGRDRVTLRAVGVADQRGGATSLQRKRECGDDVVGDVSGRARPVRRAVHVRSRKSNAYARRSGARHGRHERFHASTSGTRRPDTRAPSYLRHYAAHGEADYATRVAGGCESACAIQ